MVLSMESEVVKKGKEGTFSILVVLLLIILGGVFYGLDLYRKTKTAPLPVTPSADTGEVSGPNGSVY